MERARTRTKAKAIDLSFRPVGFTPALGRVDGIWGALDVQAKAWTYLRCNGKSASKYSGKYNSNGKSDRQVQQQQQTLRFAKDDN